MPKGVDTWLTAFGLAWSARTKGTVPYGPLATALRPLVDEHGEGRVLLAWRRYLASENMRYVSAPKFATTYGVWSGEVQASLTPAQSTYLACADWIQVTGGKTLGDWERREAMAQGLCLLSKGARKALTEAEVGEYWDMVGDCPTKGLQAGCQKLAVQASPFLPTPAQLWQACQTPPVMLRAEANMLAQKVGSWAFYPKGEAFDPDYLRRALGDTVAEAFRSVDCYAKYTSWEGEREYWSHKAFVQAYVELVGSGMPRVESERLALNGKQLEAEVTKQLTTGNTP